MVERKSVLGFPVKCFNMFTGSRMGSLMVSMIKPQGVGVESTLALNSKAIPDFNIYIFTEKKI